MVSNPTASYRRAQARELARRLSEPRRFIQAVAGPRQVGKSTLVQQVVADLAAEVRYASADEPTLRGPEWIAQQWEAARLAARGAGKRGAVLVLDEIQKITGWSETVKRLWDEDTRERCQLRAVLLGSAPLLIARGMSESLAGRFELLHLPHWSFAEMREAFGFDLDHFLFYGGYPGAAPLFDEPRRWARSVADSLIETSISRDVLLLSRVDKPALLRRLFELACRYSGQILSYTKMLGQLHEAGNATTLAHYLDLLAGAGMVCGLQKYAGDAARSRGSSPKLQVFCRWR
jgi:predicted AAA+ superfamily ATPase